MTHSRFDRPRFLWVVTAGALLLTFAPVAVVALFSFNESRSLASFGGFSMRWYSQALNDADLLASLWVSLQIALIATVASAVVGTLLAFGMERGNRRAARAGDMAIVLRLVSPETATAVAALLLFTQLGVTLSRTTVIISHVALCMAFVTVVVRTRLATLNPEIEQAAMDLGATRLEALRLVAVPVLWPSILAASLLAFVLSFDNFITSFFTSGIGVPPLPVRIYAMLKFGVTPVVNAIGVLMVLVTAAAIALAAVVMHLARRRAPTALPTPDPTEELSPA
jgi:ABC-type spermidine/putrescine transport system permease subunit II